jgi:hypothetical protein
VEFATLVQSVARVFVTSATVAVSLLGLRFMRSVDHREQRDASLCLAFTRVPYTLLVNRCVESHVLCVPHLLPIVTTTPKSVKFCRHKRCNFVAVDSDEDGENAGEEALNEEDEA